MQQAQYIPLQPVSDLHRIIREPVQLFNLNLAIIQPTEQRSAAARSEIVSENGHQLAPPLPLTSISLP
ncbi:hypothetical protein D3C78_1347080 [compost metagenome]